MPGAIIFGSWTNRTYPMSWQTERAKTRAPYVHKLVVLEGTPCHFCTHPRSSHSSIVLQAPCKVHQCECPVFDPICGCGHLLGEHTWGTPPYPWECAFCPCKRFGANMDGTVQRKPREVVRAEPPPAKRVKLPEPEVHAETDKAGNVLRWGRRDLSLYDCASRECAELASYWATQSYVATNNRLVTARATYCPPHFRRWANRYIPSTQQSLF